MRMRTSNAMAEDSNGGSPAEAHEFDELIANAPDAMFDCRKYYWPNFNSPDYVTHSFSKFVYPFSLPTISLPGSYYVATFGEPLLLTWVGFEAKVERRIGASVHIKIVGVEGNNPYACRRTNVFQYCNFPPPIRKHEPAFVHHFMTQDKVDTGLAVHYRVRKEYSIEMNASIDSSCIIERPTIVLEVQTPALTGGLEDHYMWDKDKYMEIEGNKTRKIFSTFIEYKKWMQDCNMYN